MEDDRFDRAGWYISHELGISKTEFFYGKGKHAVIARQLVAYALHHYAGWSHTAIADELGCNVSTISRAIFKIRDMSDVDEIVTLCRGLRSALSSVDMDMSTVGIANLPDA